MCRAVCFAQEVALYTRQLRTFRERVAHQQRERKRFLQSPAGFFIGTIRQDGNGDSQCRYSGLARQFISSSSISKRVPVPSIAHVFRALLERVQYTDVVRTQSGGLTANGLKTQDPLVWADKVEYYKSTVMQYGSKVTWRGQG